MRRVSAGRWLFRAGMRGEFSVAGSDTSNVKYRYGPLRGFPKITPRIFDAALNVVREDECDGQDKQKRDRLVSIYADSGRNQGFDARRNRRPLRGWLR